MELHIRNQDDGTVIKFNNSSVLGTEGVEFQSSILKALDNGTQSIIIDMSLVEYITSWGIGMIVHGFTTTTNRNSIFLLEGVSQKVKEILSKVKLDTIFSFREIS